MKTVLILPLSLMLIFTSVFQSSGASVLLCDKGRITCTNGNIVLEKASGEKKMLTRAGLDLDHLALSPDGRTITFIRRTPKRFIESGIADPDNPEEAREIWTINVDGTNLRKIVEGKESRNVEEVITLLSSPVFSVDGSKIYFMNAAAPTTGAIRCVNLQTLKVDFIVWGSSIEVVTEGNYKGYLIVGQHRYWASMGSYDWYWLLTPEGKDVAPLCNEGGDWKKFNRPLEEVLGEKLADFVQFGIKSGKKDDVKKLIADLKPSFSNNVMELLK